MRVGGNVSGWRGSPRIAAMRAPLRIGWLIGMAVGGGFAVLGAAALLETGVDLDDVTAPHRAVAGLHQTPLTGLIELALGLNVIRGQLRGFNAWRMTSHAWLLTALGVVALLAKRDLHDEVATHTDIAVVLLVSAAILWLTARFAPAFARAASSTRSRAQARRSQ